MHKHLGAEGSGERLKAGVCCQCMVPYAQSLVPYARSLVLCARSVVLCARSLVPYARFLVPGCCPSHAI